MNHFDTIDGAMHAEQVPLARIADAAGTPTYVYATATIERHLRAFRAAVSGLGRGEPLVAFAVKANPCAGVLATLARFDLGADVVSGGELARALAAGIAPERIVFSGVGKTSEEMRAGIAAGIAQFNLESFEELATLAKVAAETGSQPVCALRVNPDVDASTHAKISTGRSADKFGVAIVDAMRFFDQARALPAVSLTGIAVHIGSQITDLAPLERAFARVGELLGELRAAGHTIASVDLGGGLGVPYDPALPDPPTPAQYGALVARATRDWDVRLIFEPGRVIVGNAGILLARVIRVKTSGGQCFVVTDAGMNDLLRPSLYDAWHDIRAVRDTGRRMIASVVGPVCETGDTFATDREIGEVQEGDLVAFMTAGGYGATMASTYNSRPLAAEVMVNGDRFAVVRPRQTLADLVAAERLPDWL